MSAKTAVYQDESWLREQYIEQDLRQQDIAEKCGCSVATIQNWREKYGITK